MTSFEHMGAKPLYLKIVQGVGWQKGPKAVLHGTKITWKIIDRADRSK